MNYIENIRQELAKRMAVEADLLDLYTLLAFVKGTQTTLEDVHDAWAIWRNRTKSNHKSLIPFGHLSPEIQELDRAYMEAIHSASSSTASL